MQTVAVIIVNWNTGRLLRECVASLLALPEQGLISDIVVVDSASSDDSLSQLEEWLTNQSTTKVHVISHPTNVGFAQGNNSAITWLTKQYGAALPHILLLNPDTRVSSGSIVTMLETLKNNSTVGIVGPTLHNLDGTLQPSVRRFPTLAVIMTFLLKLPRLVGRAAFWQRYVAGDFNYQKVQDVDQVMGAAFLVRQDLLLPDRDKYVGLLDEKFFVWWEEVDYCLRARTAGWRVQYVPTPPIIHYGGVSFAQLIGLKRTLPWLRSLMHYTRKHMGMLAASIVTLLMPLNILLSVPASLFHLFNRKAS